MMNMKRKVFGYSLIELVIVLGVIAIILLGMIVRATSTNTEGQAQVAHQELITLITAAVAFRNMNGGRYDGTGGDDDVALGDDGLDTLFNGGYVVAPFEGDGGNENVFGEGATLDVDAADGANAIITYDADDEQICEQLAERIEAHRAVELDDDDRCNENGLLTINVN